MTLKGGILRFSVWNESTSGVERLFGKGNLLSGIARTDLSDALIDDELHIATHEEPDDASHAKWIKTAREIYASAFWVSVQTSGRDRACRKDKGSKSNKFTRNFAAWSRNRHRHVEGFVFKATEKNKLVLSRFGEADAPPTNALWTTRHDKEIAFNERKRAVKLLEAKKAGHLLKAESDAIPAVIENELDKREDKTTRERISKRRRAQEAVVAPEGSGVLC